MTSSKKIVLAGYSADPDSLSMSLFGLAALVTEMASQGVSLKALLNGTGVDPLQFDDPKCLISRRQRLAIYTNAMRMATRSDIALLAGARQRVGDFGIFGYALASSRTLGDALDFSSRHLRQAGPVLQISYINDGDLRIWRSHNPESLGELLPFAAEFWRSSTHALLSKVLEAPFPSVRMLMPYPAPTHWRSYSRMFNCPVEFNAGAMEWHYHASSRALPLPNANPMTAVVCQDFCEQILFSQNASSGLAQTIRAMLVHRPGRFANIDEVAELLGTSLRTLHRHLAAEGFTYQSLVDDLRRTLAIEYLEHTTMAVEQIGERVGFSDASNFRKAFKRWTGYAPSHFRRSFERDG